ncbi:MAG: glycine cleavage system protein T [Chloroflexi bacterium]|nr:MAG: glycine cleavage system protein T [Chloroflexota bacterium]
MRLIQRGARLRRSPFFEATRRYGCRAYTVYNHTFLPSYYNDPVSEYWHLIEHVAIWDVGVERQVEISGPDAFTLTQRLTPRDLSRCAVGQGKYVLITADDGGVINDPVLLRLAEDRFWLSLADSDVLLWASGVAVNAGLKVDIQEPDVWPLQLQGPKSKPLVADLFGDRVASMPYYAFSEASLDSIPVVVTRTGWTGEVGYEIYLRDGSRGDELWERVMTAGKGYQIRPTGPSDIRRIEAGILNYGADMTLADNPYELGLGWTVDLDKAQDFIGRAALRRIKAEGVRRKIAGIEIEGAPIEFNETKWAVRQDGRPAGHVTSAIHSPRLKKNIGYAMLPLPAAELGTRLAIATPWGERGARVVPKPFIDPKKAIPKS